MEHPPTVSDIEKTLGLDAPCDVSPECYTWPYWGFAYATNGSIVKLGAEYCGDGDVIGDSTRQRDKFRYAGIWLAGPEEK
jgi:hypothetical protein